MLAENSYITKAGLSNGSACFSLHLYYKHLAYVHSMYWLFDYDEDTGDDVTVLI